MSKNLIFTVSLLVATAVFAGAAEVSSPAVVVTNVRAAQRPGTIWVDVRYGLEYAGDRVLQVSVALSADGGATYEEVSAGLTGDWGIGVVPGRDKHVVWEAGLSWLGRRSTNLLIQVDAKAFAPAGMVWISPGKFRMGSPPAEAGRDSDEGPVTEVTISRGYWLGKYEVKQREWEDVIGRNPSQFKGNGELPVESVSRAEAMEYCGKLTDRERAAGRLTVGWEYRLPTEAQWEYACRAGTSTRYSYGDGEGEIGRYAWYSGNSGSRTHGVGEKEPNEWGLYDMHGNVWEWCLDWWVDRLPGGSVTDPKGPSSGSIRVYRGGCWYDVARRCRSAARVRDYPSFRLIGLGFRVALVQVP